MKAAVDKFEAQDGRIQKFFEKTGCMLAVDKHTDDRIDLEGLDTTYDYHKMGPAAGAVVMISESSSEDEDEDEDTSAAGATAASGLDSYRGWRTADCELGIAAISSLACGGCRACRVFHGVIKVDSQ